jgi:hypothetical protein
MTITIHRARLVDKLRHGEAARSVCCPRQQGRQNRSGRAELHNGACLRNGAIWSKDGIMRASVLAAGGRHIAGSHIQGGHNQQRELIGLFRASHEKRRDDGDHFAGRVVYGPVPLLAGVPRQGPVKFGKGDPKPIKVKGWRFGVGIPAEDGGGAIYLPSTLARLRLWFPGL